MKTAQQELGILRKYQQLVKNTNLLNKIHATVEGGLKDSLIDELMLLSDAAMVDADCARMENLTNFSDAVFFDLILTDGAKVDMLTKFGDGRRLDRVKVLQEAQKQNKIMEIKNNE